MKIIWINLETPIVMASLLLFLGCKPSVRCGSDSCEEYNVAAFYWPSCHDELRSREYFWSDCIGEWEMIKKGDPRFKEHYQPRVPLWGYEMGDNYLAMEKKINAAADHGVNVFIFDWYWYDGEPFLESTLNNGFLKARNKDRMKFYLMWANHDVNPSSWNHYRYKTDSILWEAEVDWENYKVIVGRVIEQYFRQPNYFKIDGKPVFAIFSLADLVNSFEGYQGTKEALDYFREKVEEAGFPGLHIQVIGRKIHGEPALVWGKYDRGGHIDQLVDYLGINSVTTYTWRIAGINEDYIKWAENAVSLRNQWDSLLEIPYIPNVSIGWDNTPRYPKLGMESVVHINNTPESFTAYLQNARNYVKEHPEQPKLIILNAWNEWIEGSYLEPDMKWGYAYLEAVMNTMRGMYDQYSY